MLTSSSYLLPLLSAMIGTVRLYMLHSEKKDKETGKEGRHRLWGREIGQIKRRKNSVGLFLYI
jgi:hypothetical protein